MKYSLRRDFTDQSCFESMCRLCLGHGNATCNIFEVNNSSDTCSLHEMLKVSFDIMIEVGDGLPDKLCESCHCAVSKFHEFREQCKFYDTFLRERLTQPLVHRSNKTSSETFEESNAFPNVHSEEVIKAVEKGSEKATLRICNNLGDFQPGHGFELVKVVLPSVDDKSLSMQKPLNDNLCNPAPVDLRDITDDWAEGCLERADSSHLEYTDIDTEMPWRFCEDTANGSKDNTSEEYQVIKESEMVGPLADAENRLGNNAIDLSPLENNFVPNDSHVGKTEEEEKKIEKTGSTHDMQIDHNVDIYAGKISRNKKGLWICNICDEKMRSFTALREHAQDHYSLKGIMCCECKLSFRNQSAFEHHMKKHTTSSCSLGHTCRDCSKTFQLKHLLEKHIAMEHAISNKRDHIQVSRNKKFPITCGLCRRLLRSSVEMEEHYESCGEDETDCSSDSSEEIEIDVSPVIAPQLAEDKVETVHNFQYKISTKRNGRVVVKNKASDVNHFCPDESEDFKEDDVPVSSLVGAGLSISNLKCRKNAERNLEDIKKNIKKGRLNFACHVCKLKLHSTKALTFHFKKQHNGDPPFICEVLSCGKLFVNLNLYKRHLKSHKRNYKCDQCSVACRDKRDLDEHMNLHNNVRPFKCELCNKSYMRRCHLREHVLKHENVKKFVCDICGKDFNSQFCLNQHKYSHETKKQFVCEHCGKRFQRNNSLHVHVQSHFNTFACPLCNFVTKYKQAYRRHCLRHKECT